MTSFGQIIVQLGANVNLNPIVCCWRRWLGAAGQGAKADQSGKHRESVGASGAVSRLIGFQRAARRLRNGPAGRPCIINVRARGIVLSSSWSVLLAVLLAALASAGKDVDFWICVGKLEKQALVDALQSGLVHRRQLWPRLGEIGVEVLHVASRFLWLAGQKPNTQVTGTQELIIAVQVAHCERQPLDSPLGAQTAA